MQCEKFGKKKEIKQNVSTIPPSGNIGTRSPPPYGNPNRPNSFLIKGFYGEAPSP